MNEVNKLEKRSVYILGLSAFYHDSAASLIKNGEIIASAQEERFTRKKHDSSFPINAINFCLGKAEINISNIDYIAFYEKPFLKFDRIMESVLFSAPFGIQSFTKAMQVWIKQKLWIPNIISKELEYNGEILFPEHHESHAASAFFASPFNTAAILTMDAVGEWTTTSWGVGEKNQIDIKEEIHFPHSMGMLYSSITYFTGFKVNSGEYKVMGLAPYGEPKYVNIIKDKLIDIKEDGSFHLNMEYFNFISGLTMTNNKMNNLFGFRPRKADEPITQKYMDLARSIQEVCQEVILKTAKYIKKKTEQQNLCMAGGIALNCVANGELLKSEIFKKIWIQPAAGDAGGALGAALAVWYQFLKMPRNNLIYNVKDLVYSGPEFNDLEIKKFLNENNIIFEKKSDPEKTAANAVIKQHVVGWFQGQMEFGPRALGNRSIIGDARSESMQRIMNLKIKQRESFRPFAPAILEEKIEEWFQLKQPSPYMLLVTKILESKKLIKSLPNIGLEKVNVKNSVIPAVTHIDFSARIQSINEKSNPKFYKLIKYVNNKTDCPIVINTSFNVRGEPIVATPLDAYRCFMRTEMDDLFMGSFHIMKTNQPKSIIKNDFFEEFELD